MSPPKPAKCMKCDKPATYKITKILKGKVFDIFLCNDHAQAYSPHLQKPDSAKLMELLQQFFKDQEMPPAPEAEAAKGPVCSNCGLSYSAYRKTLLLGCSECYQSFERLLIPDLRKIHGTTSHHPESAAKAPGTSGPIVTQTKVAITPLRPESEIEEDEIPSIGDLREEMREAIAQEDFERAAELRDMIRQFEQDENDQS